MLDRLRRLPLKASACALMCVLLAFALACPVAALADLEQPAASRTVKVGFFHFDGYHEIDGDGAKSGYGYDFLTLMARYASVNYEYVGYDKSWDDMQQMLLDGQIDVVTSAHKTAEREKKYDFSTPIGTNTVNISVRSDDARFVSGVYSTYDGMVLGLVEGSSVNDKVADYAKEHGFSYSAKYFAGSDELEAALQGGKVDGVAASSLRRTSGERVISEFNTEYFYAMVRKGDSELLNAINSAIAEMDSSEGDWRNTLMFKNYDAFNRSSVSFTAEELAYIKAHSNGGQKVRLAADNSWVPFISKKDGGYVGILADMTDYVMGMAGLDYEYVGSDSDVYDIELLKTGDADLYVGYLYDPSHAEAEGLAQSAPFAETHACFVSRKGVDAGKSQTIAVSGINPRLNAYLDLKPGQQILECATGEAAVEAVRSGRADAAYLYSYEGEALLNSDHSGTLAYVDDPEVSFQMCAVASADADRTLIAIVSKCLNAVTDAQIAAFAAKNLTYDVGDATLWDYAVTHPLISALVLAAVFAVIAVAIFLFLRGRANRRHASELQGKVDEITALNGELEERQAQLEEAAAEQEAQIEEITALNGELEERQAQLEEAAAEQEAQLEEIEGLNVELGKRQVQLEKAKDAAQAANEAKSSFLFNMSHDIRTPMNAIIGFTDLMKKTRGDAQKFDDYIEKVQTSSEVLLSIINNVLEMARIEKGTVEVVEVPVSAPAFLAEVEGLYRPLMGRKGIEFATSSTVKGVAVYCDLVKTREIYDNLLSNALKYTEPGGKVSLSIETLPCDRKGWVRIQAVISDTGIGMSEEFLPHLFEEFAREGSYPDSKVQGTGLGMPIVKRLVDLMDGTIEVQSEKGVGTTFTIVTPHRIAEESDLAQEGSTEVDPSVFQGKRILLAEDNDLNAEIAVEILGEAGFVVERAEDGALCVERLVNAPAGYFDVVLMDVQMPNMNGYEATRAIRELDDSAKASIPILAMTANAFEEDKREAVRAGMDGHLAKPIDVSELMKSLAGVLG